MGDISSKQGLKRFVAVCTILILLLSALSPLAMAAEIPESIVPVGKTVGINMRCDGVIVVSLSQVEAEDGTYSPAADSGIVPGDIITYVNSSAIGSLDDFRNAVQQAGKEAMTVRVKRSDNELQFSLTPAINKNGEAELGIWLRDSIAGIGTVTFYDPQSGMYGALGHSVSDAQADCILPLKAGVILPSKIMSIAKGEAGAPGELQGEFEFGKTIGTIKANTACGIFGVMEESELTKGIEPVAVAAEDEIQLGAATILANIDGTECREYDIEVSRIFTGGDNRKMMITVTDSELLDSTGGIVQGMSGSPIIQNEKIIGAVTHVLINNPEKGYGISIENMLNSAYNDSGNLTEEKVESPPSDEKVTEEEKSEKKTAFAPTAQAA